VNDSGSREVPVAHGILAKIIRTFYSQRRDLREVLSSYHSLSPSLYYRLLALGCLEIVWNLPIGIFNLACNIIIPLQYGISYRFMNPWGFVHSNWDPVAFSYDDIIAAPTSRIISIYFVLWIPVAAGFVVFGLFGFTEQARSSYWGSIEAIARRIGWDIKPLGKHMVQHMVQHLTTLAFEPPAVSVKRGPRSAFCDENL